MCFVIFVLCEHRLVHYIEEKLLKKTLIFLKLVVPSVSHRKIPMFSILHENSTYMLRIHKYIYIIKNIFINIKNKIKYSF